MSTTDNSSARSVGKWVAAVAGAVAATGIAAYLGFGIAGPSGITIDGPTLVDARYSYYLNGHVNGKYDRAFWTDEIGQTLEYDGSPFPWYCPGLGKFSVSLTKIASDGSAEQAQHEFQCV